MELFYENNNLLALFGLSFLAATVLPLGSEWLLVLLLLQGGHSAPELVCIATMGNYLGGLTTYGLGYYGSTFLTRKMFKISAENISTAMARYKRYGAWSLLLSWIPIIGDPLCFVAGSLKLHPLPFSIFVFIGKGARYSVLAYVTLLGQ